MKIGYADELIMRARRRQTNQRKRQPQIFFGLNILSVAHALQLGGLPCSLAPSLKLPTRQFFYARPPQTVMLTFILRFATSKQLPQSRVRGTAALIFLWLLSFYQEKESDIKLGEQKMNKSNFKTKKGTRDFVIFVRNFKKHIQQ